MSSRETVVAHATPMPKGYGFLRKGNAYLTANVRRRTCAANKKLYVVMNKSTTLGLRAPKWILKEVFDEERATRDKRRTEVRRRDGVNEKEFETAIRGLFPGIPEDELQTVAKRAMRKRSGRVGRTKLLSIDQRAKLAVAAHIRHCHTDYETLVGGPTSREKARDAIQGDLTRILEEWRRPLAPLDSTRKQPKVNHRENRDPGPGGSRRKLQSQGSNTDLGKQPQQKQQQLPLLPRRRALEEQPTRTSTRLTRRGSNGGNLKFLQDFFDDDDEEETEEKVGPTRLEKNSEEEDDDIDGSYEDSLDERSDDFEEASDNEYVTE